MWHDQRLFTVSRGAGVCGLIRTARQVGCVGERPGCTTLHHRIHAHRRVSQATCQPHTRLLFVSRLYSTVIEREDQDILGSDLLQLVHDLGHLLPLDHGTDGQPSFAALELADGRAAPAGRDRRRLVQGILVNVVIDENVLLGGEHTCYTGLDHRDQGLERGREGSVGIGGRDEDGLRGHEGRDRMQPGGTHGVARLDEIDCQDVQQRPERKKKSEGPTDSVGHAESTGGLDTATDILDARLLAAADALVDIVKVLAGEHFKARGDAGTGESVDRLDVAADGHLYL